MLRTTKHKCGSRLITICCLAVVSSAFAAPPATDIDHQFYIESQDLRSALDAFTEQSHLQIFYSAELIEDLRTSGVKGKLNARNALKRLLKESGLQYRVIDNNTFTLERARKDSMTTDSLLAAAGEFVLADVEPVEAAYSGPVEQEDMTVSGGDLSPYLKSDSTAGSKIPLDITRIPQGIQVITRDAFQDQGALSIGNIMKQVPSATVIGSRLSRFPRINIRGFKADQTRNGIRQIFGGDVDWSALSHIQNVEVLKGPGSTVFGQQTNEGGGMINVITKRPYDGYGAEVSFTRGGYDQFDGDITSGQWDLNGVLSPDNSLKVRFTGEVEGSDSFVNFQQLDRENFGLTLSWDNGGPVRAFINAEYQNRRSLPNPGLPAVGTVLNSGIGTIAHDTYLGEPNIDYLEAERPLVQAWLDIDIADNWTISPRFQYNEFNIDQGQIFMGSTAVDVVNNSIDVSRSGRTGFTERDRAYIGQIDIVGKLETGPLTHQIYIGGDYTKNHFETKASFFSNVPVINALAPVYSTASFPTQSTPAGSIGSSDLWSFAFQDVIAITSKFDLMGSVRQSDYSVERRIPSTGQTIKTDTDNTSFQVGGTFHATDSIHLFAGYGEGFAPVPGVLTANGQGFEPGESEQIETGIKFNFPWGLSGTASFFEITRSNVSTPDRNNPGFSVQTGEVRSRGIETNFAYQVTDQWYVQGGYAYTDAEITHSNAGDEGNRLQKIPEHQANIWTHYKFDSGLLKNLTLSAGANYVGDRAFDNANSFNMPNYTTVDLGASYTYENVKLELFANNLLDKRYYVSADYGPAVFPGDPRTVYGRISLKF